MIRPINFAEAFGTAAAILEKPLDVEWSLQGFGMLRTYVSKSDRLHVWDSRFRARGVSGVVANRRYVAGPPNPEGAGHLLSRLVCGPGGGLVGMPSPCHLLSNGGPPEVYPAGCRYRQNAAELQETNALDGTVTLVRREFLGAWLIATEWGTAEPRPASREEVLAIVGGAVRFWMGG